MLAGRGPGPARLWSRNAIEWSASFPQIVAALAALPVSSVKLDAEAVSLRADGRADFNRLRSLQGCAEARLIAFDLLELDGKDVRGLPLDERRRQLEWLLKDPPEALWYSSDVEGRYGPALFRHACAIGVEGIIGKRRDMPYRSGRFQWWRKIKCPDYLRLEVAYFSDFFLNEETTHRRPRSCQPPPSKGTQRFPERPAAPPLPYDRGAGRDRRPSLQHFLPPCE
jgi:bifunctional non-homologous end joining protein LigD